MSAQHIALSHRQKEALIHAACERFRTTEPYLEVGETGVVVSLGERMIVIGEVYTVGKDHYLGMVHYDEDVN